MTRWATEFGETVRAAIGSWPQTLRLIALLITVAALLFMAHR